MDTTELLSRVLEALIDAGQYELAAAVWDLRSELPLINQGSGD